MKAACALVSLSILCGCGRAATQDNPELVLLDSVVLAEPDTAPLGRIGAFAATTSSWLMVDRSNYTIREYDSRGALLRSIGRRGKGPDEFADVGPIAFDDSLLFLLTWSLLYTIDHRTGAFRPTATVQAPLPLSVAARNGTVYFPVGAADGIHVRQWKGGRTAESVALPRPAALRAALTDEQARIVLTAAFSASVVTVLADDSVAVATQSSDDIYLGPASGPFTTVSVARSNRQGSRPDVIQILLRDPEQAQRNPQLAYTSSVPALLARLRSGELVHVALDNTLVRDHFSAKLFLSVVDRRGRTCPDARVPGPEDPRPFVAMRDDTLLVLSQEVTGTTAAAIVRRYRVDTARCAWRSATSQ